MRSSPRKHRPLGSHVLEHRLDDQVGPREAREVGAAGDQATAPVAIGLAQRAARDRGVQRALHRRHATLQGLAADLHQRRRQAGLGERQRDAAAHGAGADHADPVQRSRHRLLGEPGDLRRLPFGEEQVPLRLAFLAGLQAHEQRPFGRQRLVEGQGDRVANRLRGGERRLQPARPARQARRLRFESLEVGRLELVPPVAHRHRRRFLGQPRLGEGHGLVHQLALRDGVDQPQRLRLRGADHAAGDDHRQRLGGADQRRQPDGASGSRQQAELHLR